MLKPYAYCPHCASPMKERLINAVPHLACGASSCDFVWWNNPVPVIAAIVQWGDRIVLARNASWPVGMYSMITGFLDSGEHPEQALVRETKEELGLKVVRQRFLGHYSFPASNQILMAYWVTVKVRLAGARNSQTSSC